MISSKKKVGHKKVGHDTVPDIRAAGITYPHDAEQSAERCLKPDRFPRDKPKNKFTWGDFAAVIDNRVTKNLNKDPLFDEYRRMTHGKKREGFESASDGAFPRDSRPQLLQEIDRGKEEKYHRKDFAPLGKSTAKKDNLPQDVLENPDHKFGVPTKFSDTTIKELVTPSDATGALSTEDQQRLHAIYVRSHRSFEPGEQAHRNYIWANNKDPLNTVWGAPSDNGKAEENVKDSLVWKEEQERNLQTKITTKRVQDYREKTHSKLGKALDVLKYSEILDEDHVFGLASKKDHFDAGALINPKSDFGVTHSRPPRPVHVDPITHLLVDTPKNSSSKEGPISAKAIRAAPIPLGQARHFPDLLPSDHPNHVYGIPSIRVDIHRPKRQGLADLQNYGDELDCKVLINHHLCRKHYLETEGA